jgi:glycosyltransferase involved in cell wall biosynthesis
MHGQDAKANNKYVRLAGVPMHRLAAISQPQHQLFEDNFHDKPAYIIPNGVNPEIFPALNTDEREIDLLAVGSLIPLKQYHLFIELVHYLKNSGYSGIKAVLAGNGELEEEIKALIREYGLENTVSCKGRLQHHDVLELMNNSRILVHPSSYEGHSTVMLEALYSGCKVVSFLPVGSGEIGNFTLCTAIDEMKNACSQLLRSSNDYKRVTVSLMDDSAKQVKKIIDHLKQGQT